jgi:glycosyltransferase involved in cell wall biosynthesis
VKYWLLTTEYPPFFGGGISTYCFYTAKMLSQNGHQVTIFINDSSLHLQTDEVINLVRVIRFNPDHALTSSYLGHTTNVSFAFAQIIKQYIALEGKPDIIEAQEYLGIAYYLLNYKLLLYDWCQNIPILITAHSPAFLYLHYNHVPSYKYPNFWIGEMERFCLQAADRIISPSYYLIKKIKEHFNLVNNNISIIPNPFEVTGNENIITRHNKTEKIIFYGKLSAQKGTFKLLEYFEKAWQKGFNEPLYLYGAQDIVYHPEEKTMGVIVKERYKHFIQAGKLKLHPKISPSEMALHFSNTKVVIVPSTIDNLPYVVLEMMSLGNILLVSKQGGQAEVIEDGVNGFVFDHEQPENFQHQLFKILNLNDAEKLSIRKKAQQTIIANYDLPTIYQQKINVVKQLIANHSQPANFPFIQSLRNISSDEKINFQKGLLSIVVPYYNMGDYLPETISSIDSNTYQPKEIIIINDGSNQPESLEVLNKFRHITGIKIIDIENSGLATVRNIGGMEANGEYLAFLDADDTVATDYYAKAVRVLTHYHNVHFVGCWTKYFDGSNNTWPTFTPEPPIILYHNTINSSGLVYKRSAFIQKGLNDGAMVFQGLEDYESVVSLLAGGYRGVALPDELFNYRVRSNSMIRAVSTNKKLYLSEYISKKHKGLYATFASEITGLLQANGPGYVLDNPSLDYTLFIKNSFLNRLVKKTAGIIKRNPVLKNTALHIYRKLKS